MHCHNLRSILKKNVFSILPPIFNYLIPKVVCFHFFIFITFPSIPFMCLQDRIFSLSPDGPLAHFFRGIGMPLSSRYNIPGLFLRAGYFFNAFDLNQQTSQSLIILTLSGAYSKN